VLGDVLLDSGDEIELVGSVVGLGFIGVALGFAPGLFTGKSVLSVLELEGVVFEVFFSDLDVLLLKADGGLKLVLAILESVVLVGQVVGEFSPVVGLLLFGGLEVSSGTNKLLSELSEELSDLSDGLEVNSGG